MEEKLVLKLDGVSKSFARVEKEDITNALSDIHAEMHNGEFISLVGTSGCGKSTILRLIGLEAFKDDYPGQLAGGMAQRVALVRSLINEPEFTVGRAFGRFALSEEEAWKLEPAYGQTIRYWLSDGCTSGPVVADKLGLYEEAGLVAEGVKGTSYTEALGTGATDVAVGHIATMLVPSTNGVDLTFVGGAHHSCKSLYVLGSSDYQSTTDLKGLKISVPNGIGASDYNITARLFDRDGINPLTDVHLVQVDTSACVTAMQNGEIAGALLSDPFAYNMVKDGTLRMVRSLQDEDFADEPCCIIAMNATFIKENPITAKKITECVKKAHEWMRENPEDATQMLLELGLYNGDFDMNLELHNTLRFGIKDVDKEPTLRQIVDDYIRLGLITAFGDVDEAMEVVWTPTAPEA